MSISLEGLIAWLTSPFGRPKDGGDPERCRDSDLLVIFVLGVVPVRVAFGVEEAEAAAGGGRGRRRHRHRPRGDVVQVLVAQGGQLRTAQRHHRLRKDTPSSGNTGRTHNFQRRNLYSRSCILRSQASHQKPNLINLILAFGNKNVTLSYLFRVKMKRGSTCLGIFSS